MVKVLTFEVLVLVDTPRKEIVLGVGVGVIVGNSVGVGVIVGNGVGDAVAVGTGVGVAVGVGGVKETTGAACVQTSEKLEE